ncbi:MAG: ZIP family metal transporter, partial [Treponema sp.]|nr:ZIP family metal transporter [Treponema sp.]
CFGLIPETLGLASISVCVSGLILGSIVVMGLNHIVDAKTDTDKENLKVHHTHEELYHEKQFINDRAKMLRSGMLILMAIGLHNIPEGIAIGAAGSHNFHLGALLAIMIAIHNIPEGMAIATPLLAGGISRRKAILLTVLSGTPTFFGGLAGIVIGGISDFAIALSLSAAGGAMLYIVFGEIVPQSIVMTKNRTASIVTLFGVIVGLLVTKV